ncbi:MAG: nitroreductase family protein [Candidatus Thermoplasmatota archaeon]|nr:nitroreductase family protein [Candidatus Thermoplasmatota archaeon]
MDLDTVIESRHSTRSYTQLIPSDRDIEKLVHAAQKAPSAGDLKARKLFTIRSSSRIKTKMEEAMHQEWISEVPYLILFCADHRAIAKFEDRGKDLFSVQDATIAATFAMLKATDLGLATCWIGAFDEGKISEAAGLPEYLRPVAILAVGYEK